MNKKDVILKMKEFFSTEEATEEVVENVDVNLMEVSTKDGVVLTILEDGSVMIGEEVAPDGEYILEDDSVLEVKDGKQVEGLDDVTEEEVIEEMTEEVVEEVMAEEEVVEEEVVEEEVNEVEELRARVESLEVALSELLSQFETSTTEMSSQIKALSNEPAEEEIKVKKSFSKSSDDKLSVLEKYAKLRNSK